MVSQSKDETYDLIAFIEDPNDRTIVQDSFKLIELRNCGLFEGGVKEAIELLSHKKSPKYLIVDVSKSDLPISELNRLMEVCEPGIGVLVIGKKNDVGLYRDLMKLGIADYLVSPILPEILWRALKSLTLGGDLPKSGYNKTGKIIPVIGARGGVGTSLIAANIGGFLSEEKQRRTVLVDLDLQFGTGALYCDLKSNVGFLDAIQNPDRLDQLFIERMLTQVNDRYSVISATESLKTQLTYNLKGIEALFSHLSKIFHYVLVDIPHHSDEATNEVLGNADIMVLVTDTSLAGLRDVKRISELFGSEASGRRIILVMNKVGVAKDIEINQTYFEETLKRTINHIIPFDPVNPLDSINNGNMLYKRECPMTSCLRDIVDDMLGIRGSEKQKKKSWSFFK